MRVVSKHEYELNMLPTDFDYMIIVDLLGITMSYVT